jgi:hypothetical protein
MVKSYQKLKVRQVILVGIVFQGGLFTLLRLLRANSYRDNLVNLSLTLGRRGSQHNTRDTRFAGCAALPPYWVGRCCRNAQISNMFGRD